MCCSRRHTELRGDSCAYGASGKSDSRYAVEEARLNLDEARQRERLYRLLRHVETIPTPAAAVRFKFLAEVGGTLEDLPQRRARLPDSV